MFLRERERIDASTVQETWLDDDGNIAIVRRQDADGIVRDIQESKDFAKGKDMWHIASLPMALIEKWKNEEGFDWFKASEKERAGKLNDPDYAIFRVYESKL